jgi:hypothetical protein
MKTITVNGLSLQFDCHDDDDLPRELIAQDFIDLLNTRIRLAFPDSCPTILCLQVSPEQVYVKDEEAV